VSSLSLYCFNFLLFNAGYAKTTHTQLLTGKDFSIESQICIDTTMKNLVFSH